MRRVVTLVFVVALCVPLSACGSSAPSPQAVRASIVAAALAQKSVHWANTDWEHMDSTITRTADVSADSGVGRMTCSDVELSRDQIRLVDGIVYVKGNASALAYCVLNLRRGQAREFAGRWISIPRGDNLYGYLAAGLSLRSIVNGMTLPGRLEVFRRTSQGARILEVRQQAGLSSAVLTGRGSAVPLPIRFSTFDDSGAGAGTDGRFSKWNESLNVQAPANSTPIATVRAFRPRTSRMQSRAGRR